MRKNPLKAPFTYIFFLPALFFHNCGQTKQDAEIPPVTFDSSTVLVRQYLTRDNVLSQDDLDSGLAFLSGDTLVIKYGQEGLFHSNSFTIKVHNRTYTGSFSHSHDGGAYSSRQDRHEPTGRIPLDNLKFRFHSNNPPPQQGDFRVGDTVRGDFYATSVIYYFKGEPTRDRIQSKFNLVIQAKEP